MYKFPLLALALMLAVPLWAASPADTLFRDSTDAARGGAVARVRNAVDRVLDLRDSRRRQRADTAYIVRMPGRLRLKLAVNGSGSDIDTRWSSGGDDFKSRLKAQNKYTASLTASYRGLSLSVAANPAKLAGRNKDYELNLNAYGNRLGADLILQSAKTYEGTVETPSGGVEVPVGSVSQDMVTANAYFVFSGRRFSFPAAFTQSWLQRRSAGSFMLGLSFFGGRIKADYADVLGKGNARLGMICGSIGAGYAYNLVAKGKWLFHISALPQLVVVSRNRLETGGGRVKMPYKFPNALMVGRLAVVRHFDKYFAGMNAVVNTTSLGDADELSLTTVKWRARLFVGVKL